MNIHFRNEQPTVIKRMLLIVLALILAAGYPFSAMASTQESTTSDTVQTQTPPAETLEAATPVATEPVTAPVETQPTAPVEPIEKPKPAYTFNPETQTWDSARWKFNPESGKYERPPAPIIIEPEPAKTLEPAAKANETKSSDTTVNVNNTIQSDAVSGDSAVTKNTLAGNALTGDANAMATLVNMVNSSVSGGENQKVANFTQDIMGDVKGDIILHPLLLKAMLEAQVNKDAASTLNVKNDLNINNDINLTAKSGDALVKSNTEAGNAETGSANAVANVVNILNSMIVAQESFIGTINIYGNLEGDILIAPDFIPQMLANNGTDASSTQISKQDTTTIVNNISAVAESGAASVFGNTKGGDASTGDAESNVVIFNVSGHDIVAENSLLVFVNVLGKWVGVIVDAPQGATAAMIGNGVTSHTQYAPDLTINAESNHGITNNISVHARSGDATVAHNTSGGNAVTGQAKAMANVANVSGTQMGLTNWFGVLFINVFQNWHGSFGIDTAYGNELKPTANEDPRPAATGPIQFIPTETLTTERNTPRFTLIDSRSSAVMAVAAERSQELPSANDDTKEEPAVAAVLSSQDRNTEQNPIAESIDYRLWVITGSLLLIGGSAIGLRWLLR